MKNTPRQQWYIVELIQSWNHFWFRQSAPHTMGIVRIVLGLWLLLYWGLRFPHVEMLWSSAGIVLPVEPAYWPDALSAVWSVPSVEGARAIFGVLMISLFSLTLGLYARTSACLSLLSSMWLWYIFNHHFHTSYDRLYMFAQLMLVFSASGETFSLSAWKRYGSVFAWKRTISICPQRLLAIQLTFTYLGVGLQKLWLPGWQGGEMLWYSLIGIWGTPLAFSITSHGWSDAYHVAVNFIKFFEVLLPFAFWIKWKGVRWYAMASGAVFHMLIHLLLSIWWFAVLIPMYIVFFEPEETNTFIRRYLPVTKKR